MKPIMNWDICAEKHIKKAQQDDEKIKSIRKMCKIRMDVIRQVKLDEETASILATDYYEVIKELLTALLLKNGLKSDNHEYLISFFNYKYPEHEYEAKTMHQLKFARNRVSYDGIFVRKSYIESNKLEFEHIISMLEKLLDEEEIQNGKKD